MNSSGLGRYGDNKSRTGVDDLCLLHLEGHLKADSFSPPLLPKNRFQNISPVELSYRFNIFHLAYSEFKVLHGILT